MKKLLLTLLLISTPALASEVVCFDGAGDTVTFYSRSANTPDFNTNPRCLINPDLDGLRSVARKYWKRSGTSVLEKTQVEKDADDAVETSQLRSTIRNEAKDHLDRFEDVGLVLRAFMDITKDEINILRAKHNLPNRTRVQLKNALKNKIDSGDVDA